MENRKRRKERRKEGRKQANNGGRKEGRNERRREGRKEEKKKRWKEDHSFSSSILSIFLLSSFSHFPIPVLQYLSVSLNFSHLLKSPSSAYSLS